MLTPSSSYYYYYSSYPLPLLLLRLLTIDYHSPIIHRLYFVRGFPELADLVETVWQIISDMLSFFVILFVMLLAFGMFFFALHSPHHDDAAGSFATMTEAILTTVS
jgi:hypothetical protein